MKFNKPLVFAGITVTSLIIIGSMRMSGPQDEAEKTEATSIQLNQIEQVVQQAKEVGKAEGAREAIAPSSLPQAVATRDAILNSAQEFAQQDLADLVCARSAQYLKAASNLQHSSSVDVERWLLNQLTQENAATKELLILKGSLDGSAEHVEALDNPVINRAAILQSLYALYVGEQRSCRVAPYDSTTKIDDFAFEARRIKENQRRAVSLEVSSNEKSF
ncbi:MAG: hypothetical protein F6K19_36085 [Cyanothece sp. SIO1E1]|nr:hypothetical protein [Cyanothece sp. SIO1E1]